MRAVDPYTVLGSMERSGSFVYKKGGGEDMSTTAQKKPEVEEIGGASPGPKKGIEGRVVRGTKGLLQYGWCALIR